jgi:hypothetical protein
VERVFQLYREEHSEVAGVPGAHVVSNLCRGSDARKAIPSMPFQVLLDGHLHDVLTYNGKSVDMCPFVEEDKALRKDITVDRPKLLEVMRFAVRELMLLLTLKESELEVITVFGLLNAGPISVLLELGWSGKTESIYFVREVANFNLRLPGQVRLLCRHLFTVLELARSNMRRVLDSLRANEHHTYLLRPYRSGPPASGTTTETSKREPTGGDEHPQTFSPMKNPAVSGYVLHTLLHRSSRSTVYKAFRADAGSVVKIGVQRNVEREARLLEKLGGRSHVVALLRGPLPVEQAGLAALEVPYVADVPLESLGELRSFGRQALEAGAYLHASGVVYADFKRANMMWDGRELTLIDLDACIQVEPGQDPSKLPRRFGTLGYRAPEVETGACPAAPAADVWSLGIVLAYEALQLLADLGMCQLLLQQDLPLGLACLEARLWRGHPLCDLVREMLRQKPEERPPLRQLLQHTFVRLGDSSGGSRQPPSAQHCPPVKLACPLVKLAPVPSTLANTGQPKGKQASDGQAKGKRAPRAPLVEIAVNTLSAPPGQRM